MAEFSDESALKNVLLRIHVRAIFSQVENNIKQNGY